MPDDITNQQLLGAMTEQLNAITDNMVTKQDLKDELRAFATKDDLKAFATRDDLKAFATKDDLNHATIRLERKIASNQTANVRHHLEARKAIGDLSRQVSGLREGLIQAAGPR